jgi:hypothetical protein
LKTNSAWHFIYNPVLKNYPNISNILSFLFKTRYKQNVFAVKSSETYLLDWQHVGKRTTLINSHYLMPDAFLNATEGTNSLSHTTPPGYQNLAASRLSTLIHKTHSLKSIFDNSTENT